MRSLAEGRLFHILDASQLLGNCWKVLSETICKFWAPAEWLPAEMEAVFRSESQRPTRDEDSIIQVVRGLNFAESNPILTEAGVALEDDITRWAGLESLSEVENLAQQGAFATVAAAQTLPSVSPADDQDQQSVRAAEQAPLPAHTPTPLEVARALGAP